MLALKQWLSLRKLAVFEETGGERNKVSADALRACSQVTLENNTLLLVPLHLLEMVADFS